MSDSNILHFHVDKPYLTCREYAEKYGLSLAAVRQRVKRGTLPVRPRKRGSPIMINQAKLLREALEADY